MSKLYAHRDTEELGIDEHYYKHVEAMTSEGLHSKAAIAAELAFRDARIAELEKGLGKLWRIYSVWRAYGTQIYDYRRTPNDTMGEMAEHLIEANGQSVKPHPLLSKDRSSLLAEVAKTDGEYL